MKTTDLRKGNLINLHYADKVFESEISAINADETIRVWDQTVPDRKKDLGCFSINQVKGIPITAERLLEFGFEKYDWTDGYFIPLNGQDLMIQFFNDELLVFYTKVSKDSKGHKMREGRDYFKKGIVQAIHHLQNLYFVLSGGLELTKKATSDES